MATKEVATIDVGNYRVVTTLHNSSRTTTIYDMNSYPSKVVAEYDTRRDAMAHAKCLYKIDMLQRRQYDIWLAQR